MSRAASPSTGRVSGVARVCREWGVPRSTLYARRLAAQAPPRPPARRGPKTAYTDAELTDRIRGAIEASPFTGEGYRKVWARLRLAGVRAGKPRVRRLMGEAARLARQRTGGPCGPQSHGDTLVTEAPDRGGTDATATWTARDGQVTVFAAIDPCTDECLGLHAVKPDTRFEALEPIRQAVREACGGFARGIAGLVLRHDHSPRYMSDALQAEIAFLGIEASPAFVRAPEGNVVVEPFMRTLKEQLLGLEHFEDFEALNCASHDWRRLYNEHWLIERHGHRSPAQVRRELRVTEEAA